VRFALVCGELGDKGAYERDIGRSGRANAGHSV
jgi:hypothetical protein